MTTPRIPTGSSSASGGRGGGSPRGAQSPTRAQSPATRGVGARSPTRTPRGMMGSPGLGFGAGGGSPRVGGSPRGSPSGRSALRLSLLRAAVVGFLVGCVLTARIMAILEGGGGTVGVSSSSQQAAGSVADGGSPRGAGLRRRQRQRTIVDAAADASVELSAVVDFERQPGIVIVTKIHGEKYLGQLRQSLCLLTVAFNSRPKYDIVVFTTEPIPDPDAAELRDVVHPASLRIEMDIGALGKHLQHSMTEDERSDLYARCNVTTARELHWRTRCSTLNATGIPMPLGYNWQAEFRSKYLWTHPAIAPYRYMMWWDSDAMPTRVWTVDPVAVAVRNELAIFFANFPGGNHKTTELRERVRRAYGGEDLCNVRLQDGHLVAITKETCNGFLIPQIHGWFHISSLDFYRSPENLRWNDILLGGERFSRKWDDQIQITIPAAMRAPLKSWDFESHGVRLDVMHNRYLDGKRPYDGYYVKWWENEANRSFPEAVGGCGPLVVNGG